MKPSAKFNWGTLMWGYIHTICIIEDLPRDVIIQISKNNINLLKSIKLPCDTCQIEFTNELNKLTNFNNWNKMSLFYWSVDFHNKINMKLNKNKYSYDESIKLWYK